MLKTCTTPKVDYHHHTTENTSKRRKYTYDEEDEDVDVDAMDEECPNNNEGWSTLQPILENDILCAKIPSSNIALSLLSKWFQIIVADKDKLHLFREWIMSRYYLLFLCISLYFYYI